MESSKQTADLLFSSATLWPLAGLYVCGALALLGSKLKSVGKNPNILRLFAVIALGLAGYFELQSPFGPESGHALLHDPFSRFFKLTSLFGALALVTLTGAVFHNDRRHETPPFFFGAALLTAAGLQFLSSAYDIFTIFIGVELSVFPLYLYLYQSARSVTHDSAVAEQRRLMFLRTALFGGFSSLSLAFGLALLFTISGASELIQMRINLSIVFLTFQKIGPALLIGMLFCAVGLAARVGLTPVNVWYAELKPNQPAGALSLGLVGGALAGLIGLIRLFNNGLIAFSDPVMAPLDWPPVMLTLMTVTLVFASAVTFGEKKLNRIVFWLMISQGAYALFGMALFSTSGLSASFYHLFCSIIAGSVALSLSEGLADSSGAVTLDAITGFARRQPLAGLSLAVSLLSLAGAPLTGGFIARREMFTAGVEGAAWWALVILALSSAALMLAVLRVIVAFYRRPVWTPTDDAFTVAFPVRVMGALAVVTLVYLGISPAMLTEITRDVARIFAL